MTKEQALQLLAQAAALAAMPKASHIQVEQAVILLKKELGLEFEESKETPNEH